MLYVNFNKVKTVSEVEEVIKQFKDELEAKLKEFDYRFELTNYLDAEVVSRYSEKLVHFGEPMYDNPEVINAVKDFKDWVKGYEEDSFDDYFRRLLTKELLRMACNYRNVNVSDAQQESYLRYLQDDYLWVDKVKYLKTLDFVEAVGERIDDDVWVLVMFGYNQ